MSKPRESFCFLDMDGVVLSGEDLWATGNNRYLAPRKIELLNRIVREPTGCKFVMSSVWRNDPSVRGLLKAAGFEGEWADPWKTPHCGVYVDDNTRRGREIEAWFKLTKRDMATTFYAILDDDSDMLPEQMPHFVQTKFRIGLGMAEVIGVNRILSGFTSPLETNRIPIVA